MPTIYESFGAAVDPDHVGSGRKVPGGADGNVPVSVPSNSTRKYEPPNFLLKTSESKWLSIADAALHQYKSRLDQKTMRLAPWESNMRMDSEGDVVCGSTIYLNNPVHIALHAAQNHSPACDIRSEVTLGTTSRADKGYFHRDHAYAILEYKRLGAVSRRCARGEFENGVPKDPKQFALWMSSAEHRFAEDRRGVENTRFLLQQSVHYQHRFGARFVALFDWNALVLLVLPQCRGVGLNDKVSYAYITEVTDNRKFRRALLGFLLFAYRNSLGGSSGDPLKIRPDCFPTYVQAYKRRVAEEEKYNKSKKHGPQGLRNNNTSYLEIEPQQSVGRGRTNNRHAPVIENKNTKLSSAKSYQNLHAADEYQRHAAALGLHARAHSEDRGRSRHQHAGGHSNLATNAPYTASNSTHPNTTDPIATRINLPIRSRGETKGPSRRIRKQQSSNLATKHGGSGATAVNTQTWGAGHIAGRPRQVPVNTADDGQVGSYSGSEYSHSRINHTQGASEYVGTYTHQDYPGPSNYQKSHSNGQSSKDKDSGSHDKGKNVRKFLGIFKMR